MANYGPFQGYSVFDSLMRESIRKQYSGSTKRQDISKTDTGGMPSLKIGGQTIAGAPTSPFSDPTSVFIKEDNKVRALTPAEMEAGLSIGDNVLSSGEAAVASATPYGLQKYGKAGKFAQGVAAGLLPNPMGVTTAIMGGEQTVDPYGRTATIPTGILGVAARANIEKQYDVYDEIQKGTPGYHQYYSGGQLLSIVPQTIAGQEIGYTVLGTTEVNPETAIAQYATTYGFDPNTVDLSKRPSDAGFGVELQGFIPGTGGIGADGMFVDTAGSRAPRPSDPQAYLSLVNEIYGDAVAGSVATGMGIDPTTIGAPKTYKDSDGNVVGYGTGTGGYVTSVDPETGARTAVRGGDGFVSSGTGAITPSQLSDLQTSVRDDVATQEDEDEYAQGGFVQRKGMQEGGEVPPGEAPVATQAAIVGQEPETLPEGMTVADDVPVEVPEGTFVLSAAAVEFMGSADVKKMILEAIAEAEKQGIDIQQENTTIPKENLISLVVSRGEVIIPPQLAQIIGYDRLNKINNRGKAEVERRIEENGQAEQPEQAPTQELPIAAATGGIIDLNKIKDYRDIKNPQASFLNTLETLGGFMTGSIDEMEKAVSYSGQYRQLHNLEDYYEDTMRHTLLGGMYPGTAAMYADAKEYYHTFVEGYGKIGYEKGKELLGLGESNQEQIDIANKIIAESAVDLNNNKFGRELRKVVPDEQEYIRTVERMMDIARTEGIDKVPALRTEDGEEIRLQLSTVGR